MNTSLNIQIKEYLLNNPERLVSKYQETAEHFGIHYNRLRAICRRMVKNIRQNKMLVPANVMEVVVKDRPKGRPSEEKTTTSIITDNSSSFVQKGDEAEYVFKTNKRIITLEDLVEACDINLDQFEIEKFVCNKWEVGAKNSEKKIEVTPLFQVKVWLKPKSQARKFQEYFLSFINKYKFSQPQIKKAKELFDDDNKSMLIINKQDEHVDKFDTDGDNDMIVRMERVKANVEKILTSASCLTDIEQILYIVGSDQFNSEWTGMTTKGTPQQNIASYHESFKRICDYEISMIKMLLEHSKKVQVMYVPGNHDEYVGWHLIHFLESFWRDRDDISFDSSPEYIKYIKYDNAALMFNHGDAIQPGKLVRLFPMGFKDKWSSCDHFYCFTGDKHHNRMEDFNGIEFFQLTSLSNAKSKWDKKLGHFGSKTGLTVFMIERGIGMTNIFKRPIK